MNTLLLSNNFLNNYTRLCKIDQPLPYERGLVNIYTNMLKTHEKAERFNLKPNLIPFQKWDKEMETPKDFPEFDKIGLIRYESDIISSAGSFLAEAAFQCLKMWGHNVAFYRNPKNYNNSKKSIDKLFLQAMKSQGLNKSYGLSIKLANYYRINLLHHLNLKISYNYDK